MAQETIAYDRQELNALKRQWKYMDEAALKATKETGYELSTFVASEIKKAGYARYVNAAGVKRLVDGATVSKSSKVRFHTALLVSVFQGEAQLDLSGLGLNLVQSVSGSFLVIQAVTAEAGGAISSIQPFANFSLN